MSQSGIERAERKLAERDAQGRRCGIGSQTMVEILVNQVIEKPLPPVPTRRAMSSTRRPSSSASRSAAQSAATQPMSLSGWATTSTAMWSANLQADEACRVGIADVRQLQELAAVSSRLALERLGANKPPALHCLEALWVEPDSAACWQLENLAGGISLSTRKRTSLKASCSASTPPGAGALDSGTSGFREKQNSGQVGKQNCRARPAAGQYGHLCESPTGKVFRRRCARRDSPMKAR